MRNHEVTDHVAVFESERPRLRGLAYRMLGVVADADDVVQDAWLRWDRASRDAIRNPQAWLTTVTTRLAVDQLRRRKRDQATYVGPWLPEPLVSPPPRDDPEAVVELADSLTLAFLTMLEVLSPAERAAFLLIEVFGDSSSTVAAALGRSEEACRKLASRARAKLRTETVTGRSGTSGPRAATASTVGARTVVERFVHAIVVGDEATALTCLHDDAELLSDGGPHRRAARHPIVGPDRIVRFLLALAQRVEADQSIEPATVGGLHGLVLRDAHGVDSVIGFEVDGDAVSGIRLLMNPDKLTGPTDLHDMA